MPRGWSDLLRQIAIWLGFLLAYQVARGLADRQPEEAFSNGLKVVGVETNFSGRLYELTLQQFVEQRHWLASLANWTYWTSEFTVLTLALVWLYVRRHDRFANFRNTLLLANVIGLLGYIAMPTAPPRLLGLGFADAPHKDGLVQLAANPYAAMPSLHAADALIVGIVLAVVCRRWWAKLFWAIWPRVGLVRRHGDREPLLARLHRRRRGRAGGPGDRLSAGRRPGSCRSASVGDRLPTSRLRPQTTLLRSAT